MDMDDMDMDDGIFVLVLLGVTLMSMGVWTQFKCNTKTMATLVSIAANFPSIRACVMGYTYFVGGEEYMGETMFRQCPPLPEPYSSLPMCYNKYMPSLSSIDVDANYFSITEGVLLMAAGTVLFALACIRLRMLGPPPPPHEYL